MKKETSKKKKVRKHIKHTFKLAELITSIDAFESTKEHVDLCIFAYYKMCEVRNHG